MFGLGNLTPRLAEIIRRAVDRDRTPLVLLYNDFFGSSLLDEARQTRPPFRISDNPALLPWADAVVLHLPGLRQPSALPRKSPGQLWIGHSMESDQNHPLQTAPELVAQVDFWMTCRRSSHVPLNYIHPGKIEEYLTEPCAKTEPAPAVAFVSNARTASRREQWIDELARWMPVDRYGKAGANRELTEDHGRATKLATIARHRFCLAFENAIEPDYVTEKLFDCFVAGTIPVYLGAPNVEDFLPGDHCCIRADDFASPRELAAHLTRLADDEAACAAYHAWRRRPLRPRFLRLYEESLRSPFERLFALLAARGGKWAPRPPDGRG